MNLFDYHSRKDVNAAAQPNRLAPRPVPPSSLSMQPLVQPQIPKAPLPAPVPVPSKAVIPSNTLANSPGDPAPNQLQNADQEMQEEDQPRERHFNLRREIKLGIELNDQKELNKFIPRAPSEMVTQEFSRTFKSAMKRDTAEGLRKVLKVYKAVTQSTSTKGESRPAIAPYLPTQLGNLPREAQEKLDSIELWHKKLLEKWQQRTTTGEVRPERVIDVYRRHKIQILVLSLVPLAMAVVNLVAMFVLNLLAPGLTIINIIIFIFLAIWVAWSAKDWSNDFLIITDKRVLQVEKLLLFSEDKKEIPIEKVEQVEYDANRGLFEFLFHIGTVTVTGAGQIEIKFNRVYMPDRIRKEVTEAKMSYRNSRNQLRIERMDNNLRNKLLGEPLTDWYDDKPQLKAVPRNLQSSWQALVPSKPVMEGPNQVVVHEHPIFLYRKWAKVFIIYIFLFIVALLGLPLLFGLGSAVISAVSFGIWLLLLIWDTIMLWYDWEAWHNHRYILGKRDIIESEKKPLGLDEEKNVINLSKIQDVESSKPSFFSHIFNYGTVRVTTAGAGKPITFDRVTDPDTVQAEISRLMNVAKNLAEDNNDRVTLDYFTQYHKILEQKEQELTSHHPE